MAILLSFYMLFLISTAYAAIRGGSDGRWAAFMVTMAVLLSAGAAMFDNSYVATQPQLLTIDLILLGGLFWLAVHSHRYWPIWMVGFHSLSVVSHLATFINPTYLPAAYQAMTALWSIPVQLVLILGVNLDRRAGLIDAIAGETADVEPVEHD